MTEPTDKELRAWVQSLIEADDSVRTNDERDHMNFARAVLAKWATPPVVAGDVVAWQQGSLTTMNQDPYPALGEWFVQFWEGADVAARVYGNDAETLRRRCAAITTPQPTQAQAGAVPLRKCLHQIAEPALSAAAAGFDEHGFRDWVLRNMPDDTIIGNSAWWADHLTSWAKRFVNAAPQPSTTPQADSQPAPVEIPSTKGAMWFTKKPVTIQAIQWTGGNLREVITFTDGPPDTRSHHAGMAWDEYRDLVARDGLKIYTLEGEMIASPGDWIIRGVKGEFYPCKPDIFQATYTAASPTPPAEQQAAPKAAPQQEAQAPVSPRHPVVMQWRDNAIEACAKIADAYGHEHAAQDMRAMLTAPQQEAQEPCQTCTATARTVMMDQVSFDRKPDCYAIRQITDDEGVEEWEDIRTSPDVAREEATDMMATGRGEIYEVVPLWTTPQPSLTAKAADSVLEDAERYRFLARSCRSTSEHWGGRWSIIVDGPAPQSHDSEDDFDAAIDAAIAAQGGKA